MFKRVRHMLIKEFLQLFRDPRMRAVILIVPVVQLVIFGYAVTTDVSNIKTAVVDMDNSLASRELLSSFAQSGYFNLKRFCKSTKEAETLLDQGDIKVAIIIRHGFQNKITGGKTAPFQILVDGTDSNTARIILSYASKITASVSSKALVKRMGYSSPVPGGIKLETRTWFNENLKSRNFYVPGVVAILVMLITLLLTSMAVVREKEIGTMEQIIVTPIRPAEFIIGKTLPFALIAFVDIFLIVTVALFWFHVPFRGSFLLLFVSAFFYIMTGLGIGLFISTVSKTQQQAMMGSFFFFFPSVLLSGFMFPIANMPEMIQLLTLLNPLRYFLIIVRGIFLKGSSLEVLWPQIASLAVIGFSAIGLAMARFKKNLG